MTGDFQEENVSVEFDVALSPAPRDNVHLHTLLFLHIGEIFKRECPHRRSPESIGLHDRLQAGPDKQTDTQREPVLF